MIRYLPEMFKYVQRQVLSAFVYIVYIVHVNYDSLNIFNKLKNLQGVPEYQILFSARTAHARIIWTNIRTWRRLKDNCDRLVPIIFSNYINKQT